MRNKTIYRTFSAALLFAALLVFAAGEMVAQDFENNAGSYASPGGNGVIKFIDEASTGFTGTNPLGDASGSEIPGVVSWAATNNGQTVQERYYTNLVVEGAGNKTIGNVFVSGDGYSGGHCYYSAEYPAETNFLNNDGTAGYGYYVAPGAGTRTYNGIFNYYGSTAQYVYEENNPSGGSDTYNRLDLSNSTKYVAGNTTVDDDLVVQGGGSAATLEIQAELVIANALTTNSSDIAGTANVASGGNLNLRTASGILDVNGSLNLADAADAEITLGASTTMNVIGDFVNNHDARVNMSFDATSGSESLVHYQGDRSNIVTTAASNPYGNLQISGGTADYQATANTGSEDNLYVAGGFDLADASLDMTGGTDGSLWMTGGTANYTNNGNPNDVEVIGSMIRGDFGTQGYSLTAGPHTYNNEGTSLTFVGGDIPTGYVELDVSPGTDPTYNGTNPDVLTTIQRSVILNSQNNDGSLAGFTIGYRSDGGSDETRGMTAAQLTRLLPYEGQAGQDGDFIYDGVGSEANDQTNNIFGVSGGTYPIIAAGGFPGTQAQIASSSDLFAAYTGVFTINDGRWSDGNTWVNGWVPIATDDAEVRHVVFTGYDATGPFSEMAAYDHPVDESDPSNPDFGGLANPITDLGGNAWLIANSVTIAEDGGTGYGDNIALIIGGTDATMSAENMLVYGQSGSTNPGIFVENTDSHGAWPGWGGSYAGLNGLYVLDCDDEAAFIPSIRGYDLVNEGGISNDGLIEIGE